MFQVKCESKQAMLKKITNYSILFMIFQLQTFQNFESYCFFLSSSLLIKTIVSVQLFLEKLNY